MQVTKGHQRDLGLRLPAFQRARRELPLPSYGRSYYRDFPAMRIEQGAPQDVWVLVHGLPASDLEFLNIAEPLSDHGRVLCPNAPGHGHSELRRGFGHTHLEYGQWFSEWYQEMGLAAPGLNVHLVGYSYGPQITNHWMYQQYGAGKEIPMLASLHYLTPRVHDLVAVKRNIDVPFDWIEYAVARLPNWLLHPMVRHFGKAGMISKLRDVMENPNEYLRMDEYRRAMEDLWTDESGKTRRDIVRMAIATAKDEERMYLEGPDYLKRALWEALQLPLDSSEETYTRTLRQIFQVFLGDNPIHIVISENDSMIRESYQVSVAARMEEILPGQVVTGRLKRGHLSLLECPEETVDVLVQGSKPLKKTELQVA